MARHIKKGDMVEMIAGDNKGMTGRVMKVIPGKNRVLVEGLNLVYKHVRPSQQNPQGGRINPKSSRGSRVRFEVSKDKGKKRLAVDGSEIGIVKKAEKR